MIPVIYVKQLSLAQCLQVILNEYEKRKMRKKLEKFKYVPLSNGGMDV
jgi:hypothetical protein